MYFNGQPPYFGLWISMIIWCSTIFLRWVAPKKRVFSTVFSWDILGRGRDMVFLYHNPLDSDGQLGRFQLEQISQTLGSWWQPVISGTRVSPCSKMFKVLSARVCRNFRPFFLDMNMFEVVSSEIQFFLLIKVIKKIGSCISPEKNVVDLLPRPGLSTTSKSTWGPPGGSACSQAYHDSLVVHHPLNRGLMKHTIKIWPDGRIANFFFRNSERDLAWGHNLWGWNMWLYNDQQYDMCVCPNTEYRIIKLGKL